MMYVCCLQHGFAFNNTSTFTDLMGDRNGFCVQHIEYSSSQPISSIFGQPALASKYIFDPFGWHSNT